MRKKSEKRNEDEAPAGEDRTGPAGGLPVPHAGRTGGRLGQGRLRTCWEFSPHVASQGRLTHSTSCVTFSEAVSTALTLLCLKLPTSEEGPFPLGTHTRPGGHRAEALGRRGRPQRPPCRGGEKGRT